MAFNLYMCGTCKVAHVAKQRPTTCGACGGDHLRVVGQYDLVA